jgi:hypothetical protein
MRASPIATLRRIARPEAQVERCDFCGAALAADHPHVLALAERRISCACGACAVLFSGQGTAKYRRVPDRVRYLADFRLEDEQWESLSVPIRLAYFFYSTAAGRIVALYPSPAGATECELPLASWDEIVRANSILAEMAPDVEGLLVNRTGKARQYFLAPIDDCFRLVGLIRTRWRGLSGGTEVWREIDGFFTALEARARKATRG